MLSSATQGTGAAARWDALGPQPAQLLAWAGLALLGALVAGAAVRALVCDRRYRALRALDDCERAGVRHALAQAESGTSAELAVVVLERSDDHPQAGALAALTSLFVGSALLAGVLPWQQPALLLALQFALAACGALAAQLLPEARHWFISEQRANSAVQEQAVQEFAALELERTRARTGVLLLVSLLEHRVVVLADRGIAERAESGAWLSATELVLENVRAGDLAGGLRAGIERLGALLAEHAPLAADDRNERPDHFIVRAR